MGFSSFFGACCRQSSQDETHSFNLIPKPNPQPFSSPLKKYSLSSHRYVGDVLNPTIGPPHPTGIGSPLHLEAILCPLLRHLEAGASLLPPSKQEVHPPLLVKWATCRSRAAHHVQAPPPLARHRSSRARAWEAAARATPLPPRRSRPPCTTPMPCERETHQESRRRLQGAQAARRPLPEVLLPLLQVRLSPPAAVLQERQLRLPQFQASRSLGSSRGRGQARGRMHWTRRSSHTCPSRSRSPRGGSRGSATSGWAGI